MRIWKLADVSAEPPQSAVTMLWLPPFTSALLPFIAKTWLLFPLFTRASLLLIAETTLLFPLFTRASLLLIAWTRLKFPLAEAVLLLAAKERFPIPLAVASLLLNATARLGPVVVAELLPNCTTVRPPAETARPPLAVCCVELARVDDALVSAQAIGAPTQSATMGAPAHTVTSLTAVFIGIPFRLPVSTFCTVASAGSFNPSG